MHSSQLQEDNMRGSSTCNCMHLKAWERRQGTGTRTFGICLAPCSAGGAIIGTAALVGSLWGMGGGVGVDAAEKGRMLAGGCLISAAASAASC